MIRKLLLALVAVSAAFISAPRNRRYNQVKPPYAERVTVSGKVSRRSPGEERALNDLVAMWLGALRECSRVGVKGVTSQALGLELREAEELQKRFAGLDAARFSTEETNPFIKLMHSREKGSKAKLSEGLSFLKALVACKSHHDAREAVKLQDRARGFDVTYGLGSLAALFSVESL